MDGYISPFIGWGSWGLPGVNDLWNSMLTFFLKNFVVKTGQWVGGVIILTLFLEKLELERWSVLPEVTELQVERGSWMQVSLAPDPKGPSSTIYLVFAEALGSVAGGAGRGKFWLPPLLSLRQMRRWVCVMLGLWGAAMDRELCVLGSVLRGREPILAMLTRSRKHFCLFSQAVGRG